MEKLGTILLYEGGKEERGRGGEKREEREFYKMFKSVHR